MISVVVPIYNSEKYIRKCIDSIINQTYKNLEIILINDGSKDKSLEIIKQYNDKRLVIINQENMGVAKTRNKGISIAKGKYIMFIDNDDYIQPDYIEELLKKGNNADVILSGYQRVDSDGKVLYNKKIKSKEFSKYEFMAPWGRLIKTNILKEKRIVFFNHPLGEDIIFNLNLYNNVSKIKKVNSLGYKWLLNTKSVSQTKQQGFYIDIFPLLETMLTLDKNMCSNYYIARFLDWYLLFSGKMATSDEFLNQFFAIKDWAIKNNYYKVLNLKTIFKYESDLKNKLILSLFLLIKKFKMMKLFTKIYCRSK